MFNTNLIYSECHYTDSIGGGIEQCIDLRGDGNIDNMVMCEELKGHFFYINIPVTDKMRLINKAIELFDIQYEKEAQGESYRFNVYSPQADRYFEGYVDFCYRDGGKAWMRGEYGKSWDNIDVSCSFFIHLPDFSIETIRKTVWEESIAEFKEYGIELPSDFYKDTIDYDAEYIKEAYFNGIGKDSRDIKSLEEEGYKVIRSYYSVE